MLRFLRNAGESDLICPEQESRRVDFVTPDDEKESKRLTLNPSTLKVRRTAGMSGCCLAEDTHITDLSQIN